MQQLLAAAVNFWILTCALDNSSKGSRVATGAELFFFIADRVLAGVVAGSSTNSSARASPSQASAQRTPAKLDARTQAWRCIASWIQ